MKYNQKSAISEKDWERLKVNGLPRLKGKLFAGIKYGKNGINVALSIAVKTLSDRIFVEVIDCQNIRNGNMWIIDFLKKADIDKVIIDGASGQNILTGDMREYGIKISPILPSVRQIIVANSKFEQGIFQESILHNKFWD